MTFSRRTIVLACLLLAAFTLPLVMGGITSADDKPTGGDAGHFDPKRVAKLFEERGYSPYAGRDYPSRPLWGDTHLHTDLSMDSGAFGNKLSMDDAYDFAKGRAVKSSTGQKVKLARPLDWLVITDHSDGMGFFQGISSGDPAFMKAEEGRRWNKMMKEGKGVEAALELIGKFSQGNMPWKTNDPKLMKPIWNSVIEAAEHHDDPGKFTAFIGYEWTSLIKGNNLHRVVVYRDGGDLARQTLPFTAGDSTDPEDLWKALQAFEDKTGGDVLTFAHNGNLSNGMMFSGTRVNGQPIDAAYCKTREKWEKLYEITQIKGDGEAHPLLSPDDEFADYENWDVGNLDLSAPKKPEMLKHEYARSALKLGLEFGAKFGTDPFKMGFVGSTDSHTSLATAEENNFWGKHAGTEPSADRWNHPFMKTEHGTIAGWQSVGSGYAAVWAKENTRASIFDAMERREVYGTTGPRMVVRFFGGYDFKKIHAMGRNPAEIGYRLGVPMGGDLAPAKDGKAPNFLIAALRDPLSGNLDRIQVVKGWLGADGKSQEKVYNVVWGDAEKRKLDDKGKLPPVGNTVDEATATWTNTIGAPELITVWQDPDFDASQRAFYYVRVLEIPTPRWVLYDALKFGVKLPDDIVKVAQERAYTSPIWYTPAK